MLVVMHLRTLRRPRRPRKDGGLGAGREACEHQHVRAHTRQGHGAPLAPDAHGRARGTVPVARPITEPLPPERSRSVASCCSLVAQSWYSTTISRTFRSVPLASASRSTGSSSPSILSFRESTGSSHMIGKPLGPHWEAPRSLTEAARLASLLHEAADALVCTEAGDADLTAEEGSASPSDSMRRPRRVECLREVVEGRAQRDRNSLSFPVRS
jgi:hypothetical protein